MPASVKASFQASTFNLVMMGKMLSDCASHTSMGEITTQRVGMEIDVSGSSMTSRRTDVVVCTRT